ncbi:hypothetical protein Rhal01_03841 [Rubritalea halochordaticola]|uniref:IrrE N-terminal-like domain-containing protein n=1 Tax=Rubritalea halochordaticola TaxID=714537 RepID=A0ABP9V6M3_9BACT
MSRVSVEPSILDWAVSRSGRDLASLGKKFTKLEDWLSGGVHPTLKQLEAFAKATHVPLGYLFLKSPPEEKLPVPDFRTVANQEMRRPSPDLVDTIHEMQRRQNWMRDYMLDLGAYPLPFIGSATTTTPIKELAARIRETLNLEPLWARKHSTWESALDAFKSAIQRARILVFSNGIVGNNTHRALDAQEFRGFVLSDDLAPLIFLNNADAKSARMFTLAHELVHLWLGENALFNLADLMPFDTGIEVYCNKVAGEFLIPADLLADEWSRAARQDDPYNRLARYFKVSSLVVARRCLDLGLIDREEYLAHYRQSIERFEQEKEEREGGGNYYATAGSRMDPNYANAIHHAVKSGTLLPTHAQRLTGMSGRSFDKYFQAEGWKGRGK